MGAVGLALGSRGTGCLSTTLLQSLPIWSRGGGMGSALSFEAADEPGARIKLEAFLWGRNSPAVAAHGF